MNDHLVEKADAQKEAWIACQHLIKIDDEQQFLREFERLQSNFVVEGKTDNQTMGNMMEWAVSHDWVKAAHRLLSWSVEHHNHALAWNRMLYGLGSTEMLDVMLQFEGVGQPNKWLKACVRGVSAHGNSETHLKVFQKMMDHVSKHHPHCNYGAVGNMCVWKGHVEYVHILMPYMNDKHKLETLMCAVQHNKQEIIDLMYTEKNGPMALQTWEESDPNQYSCDRNGLEYLRAKIVRDELIQQVGRNHPQKRPLKM